VHGFIAQFGYVAIFLVLVVAGLGVPLPEELTQLTAGALAHEGLLDLWIVMPVVWVGILVGDAMLFWLGRRHGPWLLSTRPVRRVLTPARRERIERHYARHAFWTVAVGRHAGGLRSGVFALAGVTGVRFRTFILADALSALVSVPIVTTLGYVLWQKLSEARRDLHVLQITVIALVAIGVVIAMVLRRRARRRELAADA
jgi:membrane protein DedA with SNARE-associated domain